MKGLALALLMIGMFAAGMAFAASMLGTIGACQ